ncbi:MAG TPA: electron transfer flavoprotein subunit alpha/FixB family protein [Longimicrobiales bacterium]|nr:electron transfer flavoprotein subunit alpha/FixB family protein [Longimicrobiales bacterium]
MSNVLVISEQRDGAVRGVSHELLTAARSVASGLGGSVHALTVGDSTPTGADALGAFGAETVKVVADDGFSAYSGERFAAAIAEIAGGGDYGAVFFAATSQGRDLAPRVAALLDVPLAGDVTGVDVQDGGVVFTRPIYSGKAIATVKPTATPALATLRPNVFAASESAAAGSVESVSVEVSDVATATVTSFEAAGGDMDVAEASVVVAGGRGLKDPDNWNLLTDLRDAIGNDVAALGASRAVVDAGWRPHGEQVGQTGKTVAPKLYFAVGISGAVQHLAGMRSAGTIVAINKDPDAPIFQVADYGIVGDLFEVVPVLTDEIRELKSGG